MTFPTTPILDDANRPGEGPPPSANWTDSIVGAGIPGLVVAGNVFAASGVGDSESYWHVSPFGPDCEVYIQATQQGGENENIYLYARLQTPGTVTASGYFFMAFMAAGDIEIYRVDNTAYTLLATVNVAGGIANGDWIGIRLVGPLLTVYHRPGATAAWNTIGNHIDATYPDAGYIGLGLEGGPSSTADNFGGGVYIPPTALTLEQIDRDDVEEGTNTPLVMNGHKFLNDGKTTFLEIENGATQFTLIVRLAQTVDGQAASNETYTILANKNYMLGPFPTEIYNQPDDDMMMMYIHYGDVTDGTVTPWRLGR